MVSVATTHFCYSSVKLAIDNMKVNGYGCIPIKFYLAKERMGGISLKDNNLLNPAL